MPEMKFDQQKSIEAILYIAQKIEKVDFYRVLKLLYFADKTHLVNYGRTITGDTYYKLDHGPCPTRSYDIIKERKTGILRRRFSDFKIEKPHAVIPFREPDLEYLSESDIECINDVIVKYGDLSFGDLKKESHDNAYESTSAKRPISYIKIVDNEVGDENYKTYLNERIEDYNAL